MKFRWRLAWTVVLYFLAVECQAKLLRCRRALSGSTCAISSHSTSGGWPFEMTASRLSEVLCRHSSVSRRLGEESLMDGKLMPIHHMNRSIAEVKRAKFGSFFVQGFRGSSMFVGVLWYTGVTTSTHYCLYRSGSRFNKDKDKCMPTSKLPCLLLLWGVMPRAEGLKRSWCLSETC